MISPLFVGRQAPFGALSELVTQTRGGSSHIGLVAGEAGIGKSRLVGEIESLAAGRDFAILRGRCFDQDRALPYAPLVDVLRTFCAAHTDAEIAYAFGAEAPELARLVPELASRLPPFPPYPFLDAEQEKRRLFYALMQFFTHRAPVVISLQDLHWCDDTTLEWLLYFARQLHSQAVLVLLTYRSDEIQTSLNDLLAALERMSFVSEYTLGRLTRADVDTMLRAIFNLSQSPRAEFLDALYSLTEGNPFFIEEVLKSLVASGDIYYESGEWTRKPLRELHIPRSVQVAVQQRTKHLSGQARALLTRAAVIGQRFDFSLVQAVSGQSEHDLLSHLKELIAAQLIVEESDERFAFRHALTRQAIDAELLTRERKQLHRETAAAMVQAGARYAAGEIAFHFYQAGVWQPAMEWSRRAGEQAKALFAHGEALQHYVSASECADALGQPQEVAAMEHMLGQVHYARGHFRQAIEAYARALKSMVEPVSRALVHADLGTAYANLADARAFEFLNNALAALDAGKYAHEVAQVFLWLGRSYHYRGEYENALENFERARKLAEPRDDFETLRFVYVWTAAAFMMSARFESSMEWAHRTVALGQTKNYLPAIVIGNVYLAQDAEYLGRWSEVDSFAHKGIEAALQSDWRYMVLWGSLEHVAAAYYRGDLLAAERAAHECFDLAQELGEPRAVQQTVVLRILVETALGAEESANAQCEPIIRASDAGIDVTYRCLTRMAGARLALQRGDPVRARTWCDECATMLVGSNVPVVEMELGALISELYLELGEVHEAARRVEKTLAQTDVSGARQFQLAARRVQGQILAQHGQADAAASAFEKAIALGETLGSRLELARTLEQRGAFLFAQGQSGAARADWTRARVLCEDMGARAILWRIRAALGRLAQGQNRMVEAENEFAAARALVADLCGGMQDEACRRNLQMRADRWIPAETAPPSRRARKEAFSGLTEREREVAVLIAQGRSNRAIAEQLVLSERTVTTHVSNILAKLSLNSRTQVAAWAAEVGLTK